MAFAKATSLFDRLYLTSTAVTMEAPILSPETVVPATETDITPIPADEIDKTFKSSSIGPFQPHLHPHHQPSSLTTTTTHQTSSPNT